MERFFKLTGPSVLENLFYFISQCVATTGVNSVLDLNLEMRFSDDVDLVTRDTAFILRAKKTVKKWGRLLTDTLSFAMTKLEINEDGTLKLKLELGKYFKWLETCTALEWELKTQWAKTWPKPETEEEFEAFDQKLTLRQKLHNRVANPLLDGKGRSAAIGHATLIAFADEDKKLYFWIKLRSRKVIVAPRLLDVIPAGMFEPTTQSVYEEFVEGKVTASLYREYLEEVFNRKEPGTEGYDWRAIYGDPRLKFLLNLLDKDRTAELFLTGVAINLFNLQPEICTLLVIKTPAWHRYHSQNPDPNLCFHFSEEFAHSLEAHSDEELQMLVGRIQYSEDDNKMMQSGNLFPHNITPKGAAVFWLGVDTLRDSNLLHELANLN